MNQLEAQNILQQRNDQSLLDLCLQSAKQMAQRSFGQQMAQQAMQGNVNNFPRDSYLREIVTLTTERDAVRAELATALMIIENDTRLIAEKSAEIAALRAAAAFKAPEPDRPALMPNPFREFRRDRRLMGP